ncbi:MAG: hypothetical protein VX768_04205 [Planctomycetota bacterium]|nr:hypothetical protein [Planctomycetota bacterium]
MNNDTRTWPELAIGLFDQLTGKNAEINYQFNDFKVSVPSKAGAQAAHADWAISGNLSITTSSASSRTSYPK